MRQFYDITTQLKTLLQADANINSVTIGNLADVDLATQTIGALAHIIPIDCILNGSTMTFTFTVLAMDIVDISRENDRTDAAPFYGNDNLHDVWNTMLQVMNALHQKLTRGSAFSNLYQAQIEITAEPFMDRFPNLWAGWAIDIEITVPNNEICIS